MVQMKKIALFILSMVVAFILVELFLQYVIGFPTYGVEKKLTGIRGAASGTQNVFKPHSKYLTVEGGLKIYQRNNLGFTGLDVDTTHGAKYIAILGNSYLEAYQVPPESTAVGVLQKKLREDGSAYEVVNLGVSGHDPMDLLYRLHYYNHFYHFDKIVLVITDSQAAWLKRQKEYKFEPLAIKTNKSFVSKFSIPLRNHSVLIDLITKTVGTKEEQNDASPLSEKVIKKQSHVYDEEYDRAIASVFSEYYKLVGNKFMVLNISDQEKEAIPDSTITLIKTRQIEYLWAPLNLAENKIGGNGHLNIDGNRKLGRALYELVR